jgi:hypothetical protein
MTVGVISLSVLADWLIWSNCGFVKMQAGGIKGVVALLQ